MDTVKVKLLGIGSAEIRFEGFSVFIDAFNDYINPPLLASKDLILFTHGDVDHFNAQKVLDAAKENIIIGPPGIAYPLLANTNLNPEILKITYPINLNKPVEHEFGELKIKVYQTRHFIDWEPDHISFLFMYKGKRIYFTGDSHSFYYDDPDIYDLDALIYSLILKDVVEGRMSSQEGAKLHIPELKGIQDRLKPKCIIGNHLIECGWTVGVTDIKKELEYVGAQNIIIPENDSDEIQI
ncbi:MAG: MBL fold metallo-hydrolase [Bacillota bacterium]|nr:MBL fold metallo-hydrolase [Bacillota bacterium]